MSSILSVVEKFQGLLEENLKFKFSSGRMTLGKCGVPNRLFIFHLCQNQKLFSDFLQEAGLIKGVFVCEKCNSEMKIRAKKNSSDGLMWVCRKKTAGKECGIQKSIRHGSWFSSSRLRMEEVFFLTYELVRGTKSEDIQEEYFLSSTTLADWRQFVNETILDYIELNSEKIGGIDKIVEVGESKFGKRKYHKGHAVEGQWVFGGVERGSGKIFLVAVHDRTRDTLVGVIKQWIEPGTAIYSDSWESYDCLDTEGFQHLKVNHGVTFVNPDTGCHTKTIESTWRHVKSTLPSHNRQMDFKFYLAYYLYIKSCKEQKVDCFNKYLEIIRDENWAEKKFSV
ncbi:hypothetical protein AVEN_236481-1 [Araneus ventricosus]|uniref:ISXO2-like transposase domain-containing protein n=1 Tax=Araneus ventricosus TaxID=182803 RepID=A0A4Y2LM82_ARAVE|nr:hypothetical protein AVEN_236481-1 [Araneus ventricosus]